MKQEQVRKSKRASSDDRLDEMVDDEGLPPWSDPQRPSWKEQP